MPSPVMESVQGATLTATTGAAVTVENNSGYMLGFFCSSAASTPTIAFLDNGVTICPSFVPAAATYYKIPIKFTTNLQVTVGGSVTGVICATPG